MIQCSVINVNATFSLQANLLFKKIIKSFAWIQQIKPFTNKLKKKKTSEILLYTSYLKKKFYLIYQRQVNYTIEH
jgi:hypothetical protein